MEKYVWVKIENSFDIKGFTYILIVSILLVLTSIPIMKPLAQTQNQDQNQAQGQAQNNFENAVEPVKPSDTMPLSEPTPSDNSSDTEIVENQTTDTIGSINIAMNTDQNIGGPKIKIINPNLNKKTINTAANNPDAIDVLVNKEYRLPEDYQPEALVTPDVRFAPGSFNKKMRKEAASALEELFDAASADGITLYAVSGYRSYAFQQATFQRNIDLMGSIESANLYSARPGESEHQTGLAMDVTSKSVGYKLTAKFGENVEGEWVRDNAHKYGFIVRYLPGKEHITGYKYEPWHIRYLGVELATAVYESGLTYEEYLEE